MEAELVGPDSIPNFRISAQTRHHIFLVIKEALHNVIQHAEAKKVAATIRVEDSELHVTFADDGCGFDPDAALQNGNGNGLGNMRKRIEDLRGQFNLKSQSGSGTTIEIRLNLTTKDDSRK